MQHNCGHEHSAWKDNLSRENRCLIWGRRVDMFQTPHTTFPSKIHIISFFPHRLPSPSHLSLLSFWLLVYCCNILQHHTPTHNAYTPPPTLTTYNLPHTFRWQSWHPYWSGRPFVSGSLPTASRVHTECKHNWSELLKCKEPLAILSACWSERPLALARTLSLFHRCGRLQNWEPWRSGRPFAVEHTRQRHQSRAFIQLKQLKCFAT